MGEHKQNRLGWGGINKKEVRMVTKSGLLVKNSIGHTSRMLTDFHFHLWRVSKFDATVRAMSVDE